MAEQRKQLQEINRYIDSMFPVGIYIVTKTSIFPDGRGYMDLHWHEELQFTTVVSGTVGIKVNGTSYMLEKGEAIFINRNALHITDYMTDDARYISLDVPEKLLGFFTKSRMEQDAVLPFTEDFFFSAYVFRGENQWERSVLGSLEEIGGIFMQGDRDSFWEYDVSIRIAKMWLTMIRNIPHQNESVVNRDTAIKKQHRMQSMLDYIHNNYMNRILVSDIADAGMVSEAECNRCFNEVVQDSPIKYLMQYRHLRSRELLATTDLSITEVALAVGFADTSYFIQHFKKQSGETPRAYRKKLQK